MESKIYESRPVFLLSSRNAPSPTDAEANLEYLKQAEMENLKDGGVAIVTFGVVRGGGKVVRKVVRRGAAAEGAAAKGTKCPAPRAGGAMSGGYRGTGLTQAEVDAITADFRSAGGVVDQSVDAQRYLQTRGAGGLTLNQETVLLPANPTRTAVYEELVHAEQFRRGVTIGVDRGGVLRFEIEAAETLIQNRRAWQLPPDEVRQVIENLRNMRAELQRLTARQ